jgi:hypothetical protein
MFATHRWDDQIKENAMAGHIARILDGGKTTTEEIAWNIRA